MALSSAQKTALKADIAANTATIGGVQIKNMPNGDDANYAISAWYNGAATGPWYVWRDLPMEDVLNLISFANMTPADAPPTTPDLTIQAWLAKAICCQGKQFNLQNLTLGRTTAPMKRQTYRAAMQDALTNIPAGAGGATIAANWTGVRDAAKGTATNAEKLFSTGTGSQAVPADLGYEGGISGQDVFEARVS